MSIHRKLHRDIFSKNKLNSFLHPIEVLQPVEAIVKKFKNEV